MVKKNTLLFIRFIIPFASFVFLLGYLVLLHGFLAGLHAMLLMWSLYVLCIPGAHGNALVNIPLQFFFGIKVSTEPYVWSFMALLNILSYIFMPLAYQATIPTQVLYHIIQKPIPCWGTFAAAFLGTFYRFIVGNRSHIILHEIIRLLLIIAGTIAFFYFTHKEIVVKVSTVIST